MSRRVVVTGLGVVASNANTVADFELALRKGRSGIRRVERLKELRFGCQVAGVPDGVDEIAESYFDESQLVGMNSVHRYAAVAAIDAWRDAGMKRPGLRDDHIHWDTGAVIGTGIGGIESIAFLGPVVDAGKTRRLGSTLVEKTMASGAAVRVGGLLALGGQVAANSSACTTGTEAVWEGFRRIREGLATRMVCGGAEGASHYTWAGFDSMRVLARSFNDSPARASRPLSASASGFVPGAGAGVLVLEEAETAQARGAHIWAEMLGGAANSGGQRAGGSMTAPNPEGVRRCIQEALRDSSVAADEIDAINGHMTATFADPREMRSWADALGCAPHELPPVTATKSMIGHGLGAAGAIESVASVLMVHRGFLHPCMNCEDLHPEIEPFADAIPHQVREAPDLKTLIKAGFGFGDVNACVVFRKWENQVARPTEENDQ